MTRFVLLAVTIPLALTLKGQVPPNHVNASFHVNHATAQSSDPTGKVYSIKVLSQSGPNVTFQITSNTEGFPTPTTGTVTISAPSGTFTGFEAPLQSLTFFAFDMPPPSFYASFTKRPGQFAQVVFDTYLTADYDFAEESCPSQSQNDPCSEFALPITTADQRHEAPGGPRLLTLTGTIDFSDAVDVYYPFTVYYDFGPAQDKVGLLPFPEDGSSVEAATPPFYALIPYDLETTTLGEIHLELRDDHNKLIASSPSRRFCVSQDPSCTATKLPRIGKVGEGTASDPFVLISPNDYLVPQIASDAQLVTLTAILSNPQTGAMLAQSSTATYPVVPAPTPIVEIGTLDNGTFVVQPLSTLSGHYFSLGGRPFSAGNSTSEQGYDQLHAAVKNTHLQKGEMLTLELLYQEGIGDPAADKFGPLQLLRRNVLAGDGEIVYPASRLHVGFSASGVQLVTRVTLPDGTKLFSPPLYFAGFYINTPAGYTFPKNRKLTAGNDEAYSIPVEALEPATEAVGQAIQFKRCDVFVLVDKSEVTPDCAVEPEIDGRQFGSTMDIFTVHIPTDSELKSGSVLQYCFYYKLSGSFSNVYAVSDRFCNTVSQIRTISDGVSWVGTQIKNAKGAVGVKVVKTVGLDFLAGAGNPLIHTPTDGKKSNARLVQAHAATATSTGPTSDFLSLRGLTQFDPPIPLGTFSADLTLSYFMADFPDDPQFDPTKLQIVAVDPTAGTFNPLQSTVDTNAQTVTAHIDGLAPMYGLAQLGPFVARNLGAAALSAGGGDNAGLIAANAGSKAPLEIDVFGLTPATAAPTISAGQTLSGTVNHLVPGEANADWLLTRAPPAIVQTQMLASGSGFDLLDPQRALSYAIFPAVEQNDLVSTEFHIANPNAFTSTASIFLFSPDGTNVDSLQFQIDPKDRQVFLFASAFPAAQTPFTGYALLSADQPLNASAVVSSGGGLAVYNGVGPSVNPSHLVVPYLGPDSASLYLVNTGTKDLHLTATAYDQAGAMVGAPVTQTIPAQQQYTAQIADIFAASGSLPPGSIAIDVDSQSITGEILFHESLWQKLAALPIGADPLSSMAIPYQASDSNFTTTLNIASTGPAATANVSVIGPVGSKIGTGQLQAPANGGASSQISDLVPAVSGLTGGYLLISSNQPIMAYAALTSANVNDFAVIASQSIGGSGSGGSGTGGGGNGNPTIAVPLPNLDFGKVNTGSTSDTSLTIENVGTATLNVSATFTPNPPFSIVSPTGSLSVNAGASQAMTVRFSPTTTGVQKGTLTLTSNDRVNPTTTFQFVGTGVTAPAPSITAAPASLNFGAIPVGKWSQSETVTITNTGAAAATVALIASAPFSVSPTSLTLAANGGTGTASVTFGPTLVGSSGSALYITLSGQTSPAASVMLAGSGTASTSGVNGVITSLKVESGTYSNGAFTNTQIPGDCSSGTCATFDTDDTTKNWAVGISAGTTTPLLNKVPLKALSAPLAPGSYYTFYTPPYTLLPNIRLSVGWSNGSTEIAYFQFEGFNNAVWPRVGGSTNLSVSGVTFTPAVCRVLYTSTQPPAGCSLGNDVLLLGISGGSGAPTSGGITVSPNWLNFGSVNVGQSSQPQTVTLTNTGAASATIALSTSAPFSVSPTSVNVPGNGGAGTAFVTFTPTTAGAATGSLNVAISGQSTPASVSVAGTGVMPSGGVVLKVDGGAFDAEIGFPNGAATAYFLNRLTPPSYPATIKSVQVFFGNRPDGSPLNTPLTIISGTNSSGLPLLSLTSATTDLVPGTVTGLDQFITFNVPSRTITSGDFVVGFVLPNPPGVYPADLDQLTPSQQRSYTSVDGVTFILLDSIDPSLAGNLAIRAVVTVGD